MAFSPTTLTGYRAFLLTQTQASSQIPQEIWGKGPWEVPPLALLFLSTLIEHPWPLLWGKQGGRSSISQPWGP